MKRTSPYSSSSLFPSVQMWKVLLHNTDNSNQASHCDMVWQQTHIAKEHLKTALDPLSATCVFCFQWAQLGERSSLPPSLFVLKRKPIDLCVLLSLAHSSTRHIIGDIIRDIAQIEDWSGSVSFSNSQSGFAGKPDWAIRESGWLARECLFRKIGAISSDQEGEHNAWNLCLEVAEQGPSGTRVESFLDEELARTAVTCLFSMYLLCQEVSDAWQSEDCWKVWYDVLKRLSFSSTLVLVSLREESVLQTPGLQVLHQL